MTRRIECTMNETPQDSAPEPHERTFGREASARLLSAVRQHGTRPKTRRTRKPRLRSRKKGTHSAFSAGHTIELKNTTI